jgi:hypothetical protein
MPVNMIDGQPFDAKGNPIPHRVTRIQIGVPGYEITIEDEDGIEFGVDPETGLPLVRAEKVEISSELKPRNLLQRLFRRIER